MIHLYWFSLQRIILYRFPIKVILISFDFPLETYLLINLNYPFILCIFHPVRFQRSAALGIGAAVAAVVDVGIVEVAMALGDYVGASTFGPEIKSTVYFFAVSLTGDKMLFCFKIIYVSSF